MCKDAINHFISETGISPEIARSLFTRFIGYLETEIITIEQLIHERNWSQAGLLIHSLKGASANLRLLDLAETVTALELACRNCQVDEALMYLEGVKSHKTQLQAGYLDS